MNRAIVQSREGITLVGAGPMARRDLAFALARAPGLVAADGGADRVLALGRMPQAVVGDMDSLSAAARERLGPAAIHALPEQETTDFDKALRSVAAPFVLALGFLGGRVDHELAVLRGLVASGAPCLCVGRQDVVMALPAGRTALRLRAGDRLSLFPMAAVAGESAGLDWPIGGIGFAPAGRIGTSNRVTSGDVVLEMAGPGMLCILPRARADAALAVLRRGGGRPDALGG